MYNLEKIVIYVSRRQPTFKDDSTLSSSTTSHPKKDSKNNNHKRDVIPVSPSSSSSYPSSLTSSSSSRSSSLPADAEMCGFVTRLNYAAFAPRVHIECAQPLWGRYVIIEAHGVKNRWKKTFSLVLCEAMVY